jgi:hypothetical protein
MIAAANRDIRRQLQLAEDRQQKQLSAPFAYLDQVIAELEMLNLDDVRFVPNSFRRAILAVNARLPEGVRPLPTCQGSIRDAIDECFGLQERLLAHRDGRPVRQDKAQPEDDI